MSEPANPHATKDGRDRPRTHRGMPSMAWWRARAQGTPASGATIDAPSLHRPRPVRILHVIEADGGKHQRDKKRGPKLVAACPTSVGRTTATPWHRYFGSRKGRKSFSSTSSHRHVRDANCQAPPKLDSCRVRPSSALPDANAAAGGALCCPAPLAPCLWSLTPIIRSLTG
jgi:hypothetical protein